MHPLRIIHGNRAVALHARLIFLGKRRQETPVLMARPALPVTGNGWIESAGLFTDRNLAMRIVAGEAVHVFLRTLYLQGAVEISRKLFLHIVVACKTMLGTEEVRAFLGDISGIGMQTLLKGFPMAVAARIPAVNRGMEYLRIDQPCCLGFGGRGWKNKNDQSDEQTKSILTLSGIEGPLLHTLHLLSFNRRTPGNPAANKNDEFYVNFSGRSIERSLQNEKAGSADFQGGFFMKAGLLGTRAEG
ncbi:MAG: hypothetical protein CVU64_22290 [Deltaproteobacteria bacterium HGW-Deltaproteobacteria-21]|nr:MAG: hypothetical protein CVU64_22290 [Deltaproteobacteria bacterium HGW-Deltaproteobacteria-21]